MGASYNRPMVRTSAPLTLELSLVGILLETPMHPYHLAKAVEDLDGFGLVWRIKQSALYALVDKLEAKGLLRARVVAGGTHPSRRELDVTPAGRAAFEAWVDAPVDSVRNMRQEFFAKLHFARRLGVARVRGLVRAQREACQQWLEHIQAQAEGPGGDYLKVVLSHRAAILRATLAWLEEYERTLPPAGRKGR